MRIVLPDALPDKAAARDRFPLLKQKAPTLAAWLECGRAGITAADFVQTGCTAHEQWQLEDRGFTPTVDQNLNAGLGPLWSEAPLPAHEPVWLAELVNVSPSRDGAVLLPARELQITPDQSAGLFESAKELLATSEFTFHQSSATRWRVEVPEGFSWQCASPAVVSMTSVNSWWPLGLETRSWRRLVNELQMQWFNDPVNNDRYEKGLLPVNSLWLFGGASTGQLSASNPSETQTIDALSPYTRSQDWNGWIETIAILEERHFKPISDSGITPEVVLIGARRIVTVKPNALKKITQWLPGTRDAWRKWWLHQD